MNEIFYIFSPMQTLLSLVVMYTIFSLSHSFLARPKINYIRLRNRINTMSSSSTLSAVFVRQLFEKESSTYTYLLLDKATKSAVLIDPVIDTVER